MTTPVPRSRGWALGLGGASIVCAAAIISFHVGPSLSADRTPTPPTTQSAAANTSDPAPTTATAPAQRGLAAEFAAFSTGLHASAGVAMLAVGARSAKPVELGDVDFSDQPAWSTIKVPLVIASMLHNNTDHPTAAMVAAITESDNAAAESLWEGLGDPVTAAAAVGKVLHDAGDPTIVESRKLRPEYTAFGQTAWSLDNQARFLSVAACDAHDQPVLNLMGQVTPDQRWGLGSLPDTKIKGGWGPAPSGRYLVRQIGIVSASTGLSVVAMAAEPDSGSFADGTRTLTQIAEWLHAHLNALPAAKCPG